MHRQWNLFLFFTPETALTMAAAGAAFFLIAITTFLYPFFLSLSFTRCQVKTKRMKQETAQRSGEVVRSLGKANARSLLRYALFFTAFPPAFCPAEMLSSNVAFVGGLRWRNSRFRASFASSGRTVQRFALCAAGNNDDGDELESLHGRRKWIPCDSPRIDTYIYTVCVCIERGREEKVFLLHMTLVYTWLCFQEGEEDVNADAEVPNSQFWKGPLVNFG